MAFMITNTIAKYKTMNLRDCFGACWRLEARTRVSRRLIIKSEGVNEYQVSHCECGCARGNCRPSVTTSASQGPRHRPERLGGIRRNRSHGAPTRRDASRCADFCLGDLWRELGACGCHERAESAISDAFIVNHDGGLATQYRDICHAWAACAGDAALHRSTGRNILR